jgi:uncharacterized protein (DUF2062 family)
VITRQLSRRVEQHLHRLPPGLSVRLEAWRQSHPWVLSFRAETSARAVAVGLVIGLLPMPGQALVAALVAVWCRGNPLLAALVTFYSNPLTLAPIWGAAWGLGTLVGLGQPLVVGFALLSLVLAPVGYVGTRLAWWLILRRARRQPSRVPRSPAA